MAAGVLPYAQEIPVKSTRMTNIPQLPAVAPLNCSRHAPTAVLSPGYA